MNKIELPQDMKWETFLEVLMKMEDVSWLGPAFTKSVYEAPLADCSSQKDTKTK
jgi:hypothetical protein